MVIDILIKKLRDYQVYAIGGYVRNRIYNNCKSEDIDLLVNIKESELVDILGRDFYSVKINDVIRVKDNDRNSHIDIYCYKDLDTNLQSRDFHINTILWDFNNSKYITTNETDLYEVAYIDEDYYKEVPLSIFRGIRIALQNNLVLGRCVEEAITSIDISTIDKNNLRKEFFAIVKERNGLQTLKKHGLLEKIIPEFKGTYNFNQNNKWHDLNLFNHICKSVEDSNEGIVEKLAMVFHDLGKVESEVIRDDGKSSYVGHENISTLIASKWLREYKCPKDLSTEVITLIRNHMNKNMKLDKCISILGKNTTKRLLNVHMADTTARLNVIDSEIILLSDKMKIINEYEDKVSTPFADDKPYLYIIIGLPRSGKSTYVYRYLSECDCISRDEIRENVFGYKGNMNNEKEVTTIFNKRYQSSLNKMNNIVLDNTNIQSKYRIKFINQAKSRKYNIVAIVIDTSYKQILENAKKDDFPIEVIESMSVRFTIPAYEEGYNIIKSFSTKFSENDIEYKEEL